MEYYMIHMLDPIFPLSGGQCQMKFKLPHSFVFGIQSSPAFSVKILFSKNRMFQNHKEEFIIRLDF